MHFLYNNRLSSNWRGEFYSVFGRVFWTWDLPRRQEPPQPTHSLVFRKKANAFFFPSVNVKEKSNNHKAVLMEVTQDFSCFVWDSGTNMIY